MADNYFEDQPLASSLAWDDPRRIAAQAAQDFDPDPSKHFGLSQNRLMELWNAAGEGLAFNNQGSEAWDGPKRDPNARWVIDGDTVRENDGYVTRDPYGNLDWTPILRHGDNANFLTVLSLMAPAVAGIYGAAAGAGSGGGAAAGAGVGTEAGTAVGGWNAAMDSQLASAQLGYTGADMAGIGYSGGLNLGSLGGEMATGLGGAAAGGGGGSAGAGETINGATYDWNPSGYTGGTPELAGGGGIGGGSGGSLGGLNMDWGDWAKLGVQVAGTIMQNNAVGNAADASRDATNASIGEQRRQFDLTRSDFAPYRAAGVNALGQIAGDINKPVTAAEVMQDPGYQFGLDQGQQALDRKIAAMGGRVSGAAIKQAGRYGTDYASTGYNAAYQRKQDRLNRLAALAGIGQTATGSSAAAGSAATDAISRLRMGDATTQGAAGIARSNIWGNAGNQLAAMAGRYFGGSSGGYSGPAASQYGGTATYAPITDPYYAGLGNGDYGG